MIPPTLSLQMFLQLPEAFTTTSAGQDFWGLKSKNIWRPKVEDLSSRDSERIGTAEAVMREGLPAVYYRFEESRKGSRGKSLPDEISPRHFPT